MQIDFPAEISELMATAHALPLDRDTLGSLQYWINYRKHESLYRQAHQLKLHAADEFAALNGWIRTASQGFTVEALIRNKVNYRNPCDFGLDQRHRDLFDHAVYFRWRERPYRPAAIAGQPYNTDLEYAQAFARRNNLAVHAPNDYTQSWHYPGWTRLFVFTLPLTNVRFLESDFHKLDG